MKQLTISKFKFTITLLFAFMCITINMAKAQQNIRDQFLVDKIYKENPPEFFLNEYIYDAENKLVKIITTSHFFEQGRWRDGKGISVFEYENDHVSKIMNYDSTHFMFDNNDRFFYNAQGQLIRSERYTDDFMSSHLNYHYENGLVVSIYTDGGIPLRDNIILYNNSGNVTEHARLMGANNPQWITNYYEYDNHPKPNFGIDYLFAFQPFPGMGTVANDEMGLSQNNMTRAIGTGCSWVYTYNEFGLPDTYEIIWDSIPTLEPMLYCITYKQVASSISQPVQSKFVVYPNPTKGQLTIDNGQLTIGDVEIFDIYGRNIHSFTRPLVHSSTITVDISYLPAGIYFLRIDGETMKIVKQ